MTDQQQQEPARPPRLPRIWILKRGGIRVQDDDGRNVDVSLLPRELRALARLLHAQAGLIDGWQPSRVGREAIDD